MTRQALTTHLFELDPIGHADHHGDDPCPRCPCRRCPLPKGNRVHDEEAVAAQEAAHAEQLRRIGGDQ